MNMKQNVILTVDEVTVEKMRVFYADFMAENDGEYVDFEARINDIIITAFLSKKDKKKVVFFGEGALDEAKIWDPNAEIKEKKVEEK